MVYLLFANAHNNMRTTFDIVSNLDRNNGRSKSMLYVSMESYQKIPNNLEGTIIPMTIL